jgi:hypothetical protein
MSTDNSCEKKKMKLGDITLDACSAINTPSCTGNNKYLVYEGSDSGTCSNTTPGSDKKKKICDLSKCKNNSNPKKKDNDDSDNYNMYIGIGVAILVIAIILYLVTLSVNRDKGYNNFRSRTRRGGGKLKK